MLNKKKVIEIIEFLFAMSLVALIIWNINSRGNSCKSEDDIIWLDLPDYCKKNYKLTKE